MRVPISGPDRRSFDWLEGLPTWARILFIIGPLSGIAVFLVWMGAQNVPVMARSIDLTHQEVQALRQDMADHQQQTEAIFRLLQRICSNTAKNDTERQRCFDK